MKKIILFLPLLVFSLVGCDAKDNIGDESIKSKEKPIETVSLTKQNFSKYIATNSNSTSIGSDTWVRYYTYFIGADYCKFVDCSVSYVYRNAQSPDTNTAGETTINLSMSGDGEAEWFYSRGLYYYLDVVSASGTVYIYR